MNCPTSFRNIDYNGMIITLQQLLMFFGVDVIIIIIILLLLFFTLGSKDPEG